jgi:hypothetical protein
MTVGALADERHSTQMEGWKTAWLVNEGGVNGGYSFSSGGGVEGIAEDDDDVSLARVDGGKK